MTPEHTHPAVQALASGRWGVERFRSHLAAEGHPLQQRVSEHDIAVTFVLETGGTIADEATVQLRELVGSGHTGDRVLAPVGSSGFRALTVRMHSDLRMAYVFTVHEDGAAPRMLADPLNPPTPTEDSRLAGSLLELPDAVDLPFAPHRLGGPAPRVEEQTFASSVLGNERRIWVSPPPDWSREEPAPCVIICDGTAGHSAPAVRDALVRAGLIRGAVVVLVDQIGLRDVELTAHAPFSRMLATELVPWVRQRYGISAAAGDLALSGSSYGGLCAAWTALHHPDVFGNALIQSPSCWFHPELPPAGQACDTEGPEVVGAHLMTPTLIRAFAEHDPVPVRIFHEVGRMEVGPPLAQIRQVHGNRWLHDVLRLRGYDTVYREFAGGHDATWWRATWADGMQWLFPPDPAGAPSH